MKKLWQRYLDWRRADGVSRVEPEESVPNKVDADQGDIIREKYANRGAGWGGVG